MFGTTDIFFAVGDCPGHCKMFSNISDHFPLDASSNPDITTISSSEYIQKYFQKTAKMPHH
jgi:hypothetical protein